MQSAKLINAIKINETAADAFDIITTMQFHYKSDVLQKAALRETPVLCTIVCLCVLHAQGAGEHQEAMVAAQSDQARILEEPDFENGAPATRKELVPGCASSRKHFSKYVLVSMVCALREICARTSFCSGACQPSSYAPPGKANHSGPFSTLLAKGNSRTALMFFVIF